MTDKPSLSPIQPLAAANSLTRNPIAPPPKICWIGVDRLMVDVSYQRAIGRQGRANIQRLVEGWDWNCYKPLSVAPVEDRGGYYEVIDVQHSAIAAATHGSIEMLPCVVLVAADRAAKAKAFLGINRDRVTLTAYALFRAKVAAGDPVAVDVARSLERCGATLVESLQAIPDDDFRVGLTAAVGALTSITKRHTGVRLRRLLTIAVKGEALVINAGLLMGLNVIVERPDAPTDAQLTAGIREAGAEDLADAAMQQGRSGDRKGRSATDAWVTVILAAADRVKVAA
ncbi:MAG: hypothetical protein ACOYM5_02845 [Caulobacter sp.]